MTLDAALREGHPEAVSSMLAEGAWGAVLAHVLEDPVVSTPALVEELHRQAPRTDTWWHGVKDAMGQHEQAHNVLLSASVVRKAYFAWLESSCETLGAQHPLAVQMRVDRARSTTQNLDEVQALYDSLDALPNGDTHLVAVSTIGAQRALEAGQPKRAVAFAKTAAEAARTAGDSKALDVAARLLAGAHVEARNFKAAFMLYDLLLEKRGPMFGGGMAVSMGGGGDARSRALTDIRVIGGWASRMTPEWVRALGSLALAFEDDERHGAPLRKRFEDAVHDLTAGERAVDDFEVVLRQLGERGHFAASLVASRIGSDAIPEDTWLLSAFANQAARAGEREEALDAYRRLAQHESAGTETRWFAWDRVGAMAAQLGDDDEADAAWARASELAENDEQRHAVRLSMAEARAASRPDEAIANARAVFDAIREDPQILAENTLGHRTVDALARLLAARGDRAALEVQGSLIDAKKALWGDDVPAVWVERHNLGAVHADLGETEEARTLVTEAHAKLLAMCGPDHPHTQLCVRTLAKLDA